MHVSRNYGSLNDTPVESRLRSLEPWAATLICMGALTISILGFVHPPMVASRLAPGAFREPIMTGILGTCGGIALFLLFVRWLRFPPHIFFIRVPGRHALLWIGITSAAASILLILAIVMSSTSVAIQVGQPNAMTARIVAAVAIGLWTGTIEELLFRGVFLSVLGYQWQWPGAILVTALLFGFLHHGGADTLLATVLYIGVTTIAGALFGILVVVTGNVWNAVAFHATWNAVFSGYLISIGPTPSSDAILAITLDPGWMLGAGDSAVPESPLAIVLIGAILGLYLWFLSRSALETVP